MSQINDLKRVFLAERQEMSRRLILLFSFSTSFVCAVLFQVFSTTQPASFEFQGPVQTGLGGSVILIPETDMSLSWCFPGNQGRFKAMHQSFET